MSDLNKAIETYVDELFAEPVAKASENFEVAPASKTLADKVMAEAPKSPNDESRGVGRPEDDHDVPDVDQDGNPHKGYEAVQKIQPEVENPEVNQSGAVTQISEEGRLSEKKHMKDPRLSKTLTDAEFTEYQELKKA